MKLGIIGAMDLEVESLVNSIKNMTVERISGMEFNYGQIFSRDVVVVKCGVGKVNAAICSQILISYFKVTHIINTGVAGSLSDSFDIGDILVSRDVVYHDFDITSLGRKRGEVPGLGCVEITADLNMAKWALWSAEDIEHEASLGRVATGDQFISNNEVKRGIVRDLAADCVEMEGAAIGHCCYLNNIPFVVIRAISDKADGTAPDNYTDFERKAASISSDLVIEFIKIFN